MTYSRRLVFLGYITILTLLPAIFLLPLHGLQSGFWLLTGDAYIYLSIAEISRGGFFTFDGEAPTNGFHPLWQYYLTLMAHFAGGNKLLLMNISAWTCVALLWGGVLSLSIAIQRVTSSYFLAILPVPGVYFLAFGQGFRNLSVWNFFQGMEAGLAFFLTGLLALQITRFETDEHRLDRWCRLGVILAFIVLTRLDEVFAVLGVGVAWIAWRHHELRTRLRDMFVLGAPAALVLAIYFVHNWSSVGVLLPVSGAAKGDGALVQNGYVTLVNFFGPLLDLREAVSDYDGDRASLHAAAFRVSELVVPAVFSLFFISILWHHFRMEPWAPLAAGICVGIILKAGYNFTNVNYWHQSAWYFALASGWLSFVTALMLKPVADRVRATAPLVGWLLLSGIVLVSLLQSSSHFAQLANAQEPIERRAFVDSGVEIESALEARMPGGKVLEFGDGIINFALGIPVRHGFVFAGDPKSLAALQAGRLLRESYADGYTLLGSYEYLRWPEVSVDQSSDEIRRFLTTSFLDHRIKGELRNFEFKVVYVYEPLSIPFIAMKRVD